MFICIHPGKLYYKLKNFAIAKEYLEKYLENTNYYYYDTDAKNILSKLSYIKFKNNATKKLMDHRFFHIFSND